MPYSAEKGLDIAFHSDRMITPASKKLFSPHSPDEDRFRLPRNRDTFAIAMT
jgi:hypothetical protein